MEHCRDKKKDIFDKIMHYPCFRIFEPFYQKNKEVLLYLLFGGLSFFINIGLFFVVDNFTIINEMVNNIFCWCVCVMFQFITNRTWVFNGYVETLLDFVKQISSFFSGRLFTLVLEEIIIVIFISWMQMNSMLVKLIAQVVVIVLNYIISKIFVFNK